LIILPDQENKFTNEKLEKEEDEVDVNTSKVKVDPEWKLIY